MVISFISLNTYICLELKKNIEMKKIFSLCFVGLLLGCQNSERINEPLATNIIFLIGDGMGLAQISAGINELEEPLNFERFTHVGLSKTASSSHRITDSAAGASAFSIGEKTYNGAIGVTKDTLPKETLFETGFKHGYKNGLVVTSEITHATPASFFAHQKSRKMNEEIAEDLLNSNVSFFAGGGIDFFTNRSDQRDLVSEFQNKGFQMFVDTTYQLPQSAFRDKTGCLVAKRAPGKAKDRKNYLYDFSKGALKMFTNLESKFFLLIEGSQIDWGGHANDKNYVLSELYDFDKTIGLCLDYADAHPNTLVLVTADHETGGLTLGSKNGNYDQIDYRFATGGHTNIMVPVFAYGKGAENFSGIYENTEIYAQLLKIIEKRH